MTSRIGIGSSGFAVSRNAAKPVSPFDGALGAVNGRKADRPEKVRSTARSISGSATGQRF